MLEKAIIIRDIKDAIEFLENEIKYYTNLKWFDFVETREKDLAQFKECLKILK